MANSDDLVIEQMKQNLNQMNNTSSADEINQCASFFLQLSKEQLSIANTVLFRMLNKKVIPYYHLRYLKKMHHIN